MLRTLMNVRRLRVTGVKFGRMNHTSSLFNEGFTTKTLDRVHRLRYNSMNREINRYGKRNVELHMTLQDLLVQLHEDRRENTLDFRWKLVQQKPKLKLIEPLLFHTILALSYIQNTHKLDPAYIAAQTAKQRQFLHDLSQKITKNRSINKAQLTSLCQDLFEQIGIEYVENDIIKQCVEYYLCIVQKTYTMTDFTKWTKSILANNVTEACEQLRNLTNIPEFILVDVILRTPMSKQEFQLQLDMWLQFIKPITIAYINKTSIIKTCFNNLLFYSIHQLPNNLAVLITQSLNFFTDEKSGCQNTIVTPDYINEIIWDLAYNSIRGPSNDSSNYIIKGQEILVKYLGSVGTPQSKSYQKLSLKGYMAIAMAIRSTSPEKALQIFHIAESRFSHPSKKDLAAYNIVKTFLASTPEDLILTFNTTAANYAHLSLLWLVFIKKLEEFHLLNEARSIKMINEMMKHKLQLIISKDIIGKLVHTIRGVKSFDKFVNALDKDLIERYSNILIPKYMSMLYKNHASILPEATYPWDRAIKADFKPRDKSFKGFSSIIEYARYLYRTKVKKSPRNIGIMLQGEAIYCPENVYTLYKSELKNLSPDSGCIYAIIKAAMKSDSSGNCIVWGDLYAPQVAVHIFKLNVGKLDKDVMRIFPDTRLWQKYIRLLTKYGYLEELALLIQWWEKIKYYPNHETLLLLLLALPCEHSKRYISHYEKVKEDSKKMNSLEKQEPMDSLHWPWPTQEQVENFKEKDEKK